MTTISDRRYQQIAIDCNNLFFRSVASCAKHSQKIDSTFVYTHIITDVIDRIKNLQSQFGYTDTTMYLLFDNPKSKINTRKLIDEHYKSHRANDAIPKEFWDTLALLEMVLRCYANNFVIMRLSSCEADDLILPLIVQKVNDKKNMLLVSADLDWSRGLALHENVGWFNYHTHYWHRAIFKEEHGFFPERNKIKFYKTIRGDNSDDIEPSLPYMPESLVIHIVDHYDDIEKFVETYNRDEKIPTHWKQKISDARSKILSNYSLVDFIHICEDIESYSFHCKENVGELRYWYKLLDLPLEKRMIVKEDGKQPFLKVKKLPRIKRFNLD